MDVVGALLHVLLDERATGPVNIVAPEATTNRAFATALGHALHRPAFAPAPAFMLRLVLGSGRADELLLASQRVVPSRLRELGYVFQHAALEEALLAAICPDPGTRDRPRSAV